MSLLAFALGCGGRSGLDLLGAASYSGDAGIAAVGTCVPGGEDAACIDGGEGAIESPQVPGGTYYRTYANSGSGATGEADPATVSTFRLDKYEVTVARFRGFVSAWNGGTGYTPPAGSGKHAHLNGGKGLNGSQGAYEPGWLASDSSLIAPTDANLHCESTFATWTPSVGTNENRPMNCVTWEEAYAFCIWDGGFLPSEAEWEYAAAGGSQQRAYPWGSAAPGTGSKYAIYNCYYPSGAGSSSTMSGCTAGAANIASVGTAAQGAGVWGQLDLAGNVEEWILDGLAPYVNPCTDCADTTAPASRVIRGGAFSYGAASLPPPSRDAIDYSAPSIRDINIGFRCARAP
jgi:formylglycine-generating enzyme required for sulfatase activity